MGSQKLCESDDADDTVSDEGQGQRQIFGLSPMQALLSVVKCAIGAGSFTIPKQFYDNGIMLSMILIILVGSISCYTLCLLLQCDEDISSHLKSVEEKYKISLQTELKEFSVSIDDNDDDISSDLRSYDDHNFLTHEVPTPVYKNTRISYPEIGSLAFPEFTVYCCGASRNLLSDFIFMGIALTSVGVSAAYIDFISSTFPMLLSAWTDNSTNKWLTKSTTPLFITPLLLLLSYLRDFKSLVVFSIIGDLAVCSGCIAVLVYGGLFTQAYNTNPWQRTIVSPSPSEVPKFVGCSTFLFAVHIVMLPIMQQLTLDKDSSPSEVFAKKQLHTKLSYILLIMFNIAFGISGCCLYTGATCNETVGDWVSEYNGPCTNVLTNIATGNFLDSVKFLICMDLLLTIPLVLAATRELLEPRILEYLVSDVWVASAICCVAGSKSCDTRRSYEKSAVEEVVNPQHDTSGVETKVSRNTLGAGGSISATTRMGAAVCCCNKSPCTGSSEREIKEFLIRYGVRTLLVFTVVVIAMGIPNFGNMVDLVGGVVCSLTGYVLPPLLFMRVSSIRRKPQPLARTCLHIGITIFGVVTMVTTTYYAIPGH